MASSASGSDNKDIFFTRKFLYDKMNESGHNKLEDQILFLKQYLEKQTNCPPSNVSNLHKKISNFICDFKKKWASSYRMKERFLTKNDSWLKASISFPNYENLKKGSGRPALSFLEASERSKRMKTQELRSEHSTEELCYAAQMSLRSSGEIDAAKLVKEVTSTTPKRATRYKTAFKKSNTSERIQLLPEEALSVFVEAQLTRNQYNIIRSKDKERFPSYKKIQEAKNDCYPNKQYIAVTDSLAEIKLQGLLDHTASRLMQTQREMIERQTNLQQLHLITKWGFDGSSGHSEYKQKFASSSASDASIFLSSLVPLRLISGDSEGAGEEQIILWNNTRSSSTRYCRPIRFQFAHETTDLAKTERDYIESQIRELVPTVYEIGDGRNVEIQHKLLFTMVDGKICNSLTDTTSTMRCFICNLTSKDFNDIKTCTEAEICESGLQFGMSTLHAWIRFFECLLHLAYKLPIKIWQARGEENKNIVETTKKEIREKFRSQLGLIVDKPKPGYGSSNDGNTARRFFENADVSSSITGIDVELIKRFRTVLKTVASGYPIKLELFKSYALETAHLFVEKYPWYCMPPTVHKVLIHGPIIINKALLPIGQLSEEAQEANNKMFKRYREGFSRKFSREQTNEDILNRLLISSDPLITSMHQPKTRKTSLDVDVMQLLEAPDFSALSSTEQESDSGDSSS